LNRWSPYKATIISSLISTSVNLYISLFPLARPMFGIMLTVRGVRSNGACMTLLNSYAASIKTRSTRAIFNILYIGQNLGIVIGTLMVGFLLKHGITLVFTVTSAFYAALVLLTILEFNVHVDRRVSTKPVEPGAPVETRLAALSWQSVVLCCRFIWHTHYGKVSFRFI